MPTMDLPQDLADKLTSAFLQGRCQLIAKALSAAHVPIDAMSAIALLVTGAYVLQERCPLLTRNEFVAFAGAIFDLREEG